MVLTRWNVGVPSDLAQDDVAYLNAGLGTAGGAEEAMSKDVIAWSVTQHVCHRSRTRVVLNQNGQEIDEYHEQEPKVSS